MHEKIDFSYVERLEPFEDSFDKVLLRIEKQKNVIPFKVASVFALAASITIVCVSVILSAFSLGSTESVPIKNIVSMDDVAWFSSLGNEETSDFEYLENSLAINYLMR